MRIGWICCRNKELKAKLLSYKSTADLHTNIFCQMVLAQYLADNDLDQHIEKTKVLYKQKAELMMDCMKKYLPAGVTVTPTQGGMFLWGTLPEGITAVDLYARPWIWALPSARATPSMSTSGTSAPSASTTPTAPMRPSTRASVSWAKPAPS